MSKKKKLLGRLKERPKDFTWDEAVSLLRGLGFSHHGKTGSSHQSFVHEETRRKIFISRPHPQPTLKDYQIDGILEVLSDLGLLE